MRVLKIVVSYCIAVLFVHCQKKSKCKAVFCVFGLRIWLPILSTVCWISQELPTWVLHHLTFAIHAYIYQGLLASFTVLSFIFMFHGNPSVSVIEDSFYIKVNSEWILWIPHQGPSKKWRQPLSWHLQQMQGQYGVSHTLFSVDRNPKIYDSVSKLPKADRGVK